MTKHSSTLLAQSNEPIEIQKADLDLLKKINGSIDETSTGLDEINSKVNGLLTLAKDPTGFDYPINATVSYDFTNRTITLGGTFVAYWQGIRIPSLLSGWVSPPHPIGITVPYFLYYNGTSFIWSTASWTFDMLQIAYISATSTGVKFALRECHGVMGWQNHQEFHQTIGTYLESGGDLSNYTLNSTTLKNPFVAAATIKDEDLQTVNPIHNTGNNYTNIFLTTTGITNFATGAARIVPVLANNPYYNEFLTGAWRQTLMPNNSYMCVWLIAMPVASDTESQKYRYLWVQGQSTGTLVNQQALTPNNVNVGTLTSLSPEFVFIGRIIIRFTANNWSITQVDKIFGTRVNQVITSGTGFDPTNVAFLNVANTFIENQTVGGNLAGGLRYLDISNTDPTPNSGAIQRLIKRNQNNTADIPINFYSRIGGPVIFDSSSDISGYNGFEFYSKAILAHKITDGAYNMFGPNDGAHPAIRVKKVTGTTPATETNATVAHGLTIAKIISITCILEHVTNAGITHNFSVSGYLYDLAVDSTNIIVALRAGLSGNILSKAFRVTIVYQE